MKIMFASDIHGSTAAAKKIANKYKFEGADRLVLLGDILYHGPRNPLPEDYNPQEVANILNSLKQNILCVRGNCDSEVDQMLLQFPIMAPYVLLNADGHTMFLTHGHLYNEDQMPPIQKGDIFINGHTHVPCAILKNDNIFLNPGSASLPKNDFAPSYMLYENGSFTICSFDAERIFEISC
ncbi:MAG: phosphodiesterase [Ruminococcaceae bacterium]|nr:phosphodiesterase [Oscillospiraceae bacterium]